MLSELRDGTYTGIDLRTRCLTFCEVLTAHHEAADEGGFPLLGKHCPELRPVLDELSRDHRQIAEVLDRLKLGSTMDAGELATLAGRRGGSEGGGPRGGAPGEPT